MNPDLLGVILAGGRNSRFGADKARIDRLGQPLIQWIRDRLATRCDAVIAVSGQADAYSDLGIDTIADRAPDAGPLAGLDAALSTDRPATWLVVVPCDCIGFDPEWIDRLREATIPGDRGAAFHGSRGWEPLPALIHRGCREVVLEHLEHGRRSLHGLLDAMDARRVPLPATWPDIVQVNSPDELNAWRQRQTE